MKQTMLCRENDFSHLIGTVGGVIRQHKKILIGMEGGVIRQQRANTEIEKSGSKSDIF